MPTYEYQCTEGHVFEAFQKISDRPRTKCPTCGARATRVISGGAGLIFKGSGFYITDYGKDGKGPRKDSDRSEPAETKAKSESATADSSTSAPEAKSATDKPAPGKKAKKAPKGDA